MANKAKPLFFHRYERSEHGYTTTYIRIFHGQADAIGERIAECVGNKAGYASQETADRVMAKLVSWRDHGKVTHIVDSMYMGPSVKIAFQHYKGTQSAGGEIVAREYCQPRFELGEDLSAAENAAKLARKVMRRAGIAGTYNLTPDHIIAGLAKLKATQVKHNGDDYVLTSGEPDPEYSLIMEHSN